MYILERLIFSKCTYCNSSPKNGNRKIPAGITENKNIFSVLWSQLIFLNIILLIVIYLLNLPGPLDTH